MQGDGVPKDILGGFAYIDKAAEQGNIGAEFNAGDLYWSGRVKGINKDDTKARLYLSRAAKKGHPQAKQVCTKWGIPL
jgi:TPR repeat protein